MNPVRENRRTLRAQVQGWQARTEPNVLSPHVISELDRRSAALLQRLFIQESGRRQILDSKPERLEQRDLVTTCSPLRAADEDLTDFSADVAVTDRTFSQREQVIARFVDRRFAAVDEKRCGRERGTVELTGGGDARPDGIDVRPTRDPLALDDGLARARRGGDDARTANGVFDRIDDPDPPVACGNRFRFLARATDDANLVDLSYERNRSDMGACLHEIGRA